MKKPSSFEGSGKYAWQAAIYIKKNETYKDFICAGTLISSNVILTGIKIYSKLVYKINETILVNFSCTLYYKF